MNTATRWPWLALAAGRTRHRRPSPRGACAGPDAGGRASARRLRRLRQPRGAAERRAQEGRAAGTLRGILPSFRESRADTSAPPIRSAPSARASASAPLTAASFDPARLNDPEAIGTVSSALVVEQPLINADAWLGRSAARRGAEAARESERWTRSGSAVDVIRAYYGAVLAGEQIAALDSAARAAHAHERQAESLHRNGVAARSDALLAAVRASEADTRLVAAQGAGRLARVQLALALGAVDDTAFVLPDSLPDADALSALVAAAGDESPARSRRRARGPARAVGRRGRSPARHRASAAPAQRLRPPGLEHGRDAVRRPGGVDRRRHAELEPVQRRLGAGRAAGGLGAAGRSGRGRGGRGGARPAGAGRRRHRADRGPGADAHRRDARSTRARRRTGS